MISNNQFVVASRHLISHSLFSLVSSCRPQ